MGAYRAFRIRGWRGLCVASGAAVLVMLAAVRAQHTDVEDGRSIDATLMSLDIESRRMDAAVIISWNSLAHDIAFAEDQFLTFKGQRALAMTHLAIHDALNAIVPAYEPYAYRGSVGLAHPMAAAGQAAHDVLLSQYPGQQKFLAKELARWLSQVRPGVPRNRGVELGQAAAAAVLARRVDDRWDFPGKYEFSDAPGRYRSTPPWNGFIAQPGFRFAKPFALEYPHQFRPAPPPPLRSKAYARALREVQDYGAIHSMRRTDDQTGYAIWWMEFAEGSVNRLARQLAGDRQMHLWAAARMFAHIAVTLYDTYVATWDAKYAYDHWRPYTAIRAADTDGNPDTAPDAVWEALRPAPPFPEYSSAHAAACAASFGVLADVFGRDLPFNMETTTAPSNMPSRTFDSFPAAAAECADSRVRLGWHFRYATDAGLVLGQRISRYVLSRTLRARSRRF